MNSRCSIVLAAALSWTCSPIAANALPIPTPSLAAPVPSLTLSAGSTGPVDQDNRATEVGVQASYNSTGTEGLTRTSAGLIGGEATAGGTILLGPSPGISVSAHAEANGTVPDTALPSRSGIGFGSDIASAAGTLRYQFEIPDPKGPAGPIDMNIDGMIGVTAVGGGGPISASSNEEIEVLDLSGNLIVGDYLNFSTNPAPAGSVFLRHVFTDNAGIQHTVDNSSYSSNTYHESGTYRFQTNQVYSVHLVATAGANIQVSQVNASAITINGFVDPVFTIVGPNAGNLKLVFSEGIGNAAAVPLPPSVWLAASGLGSLFRLGEKRRSQARCRSMPA